MLKVSWGGYNPKSFAGVYTRGTIIGATSSRAALDKAFHGLELNCLGSKPPLALVFYFQFQTAIVIGSNRDLGLKVGHVYTEPMAMSLPRGFGWPLSMGLETDFPLCCLGFLSRPRHPQAVLRSPSFLMDPSSLRPRCPLHG